MIISKGIRNRQLAILIAFGCFFLLLLLTAVVTANANYFLIIVFGILFFGPFYLISLKNYDIVIDDHNFIISNLFKKYIVVKSKFERVVPGNTLPTTFNNPFFTIVFSDGSKYNFVYRGNFKDMFKTRVSRAKKITDMVMLHCNGISNKAT